MLEGVYKKDLAQDDFMFADDRHLIIPTSANADHVSAEHFLSEEGSEAGAPSAGETAAQFQASFDDNNVKYGSDGQNDVFQATARSDFFFGLAGDDRLYGGAGDDHLSGDAGNDILDGADGQDDLRRGDGDDKLYGGAMGDSLRETPANGGPAIVSADPKSRWP